MKIKVKNVRCHPEDGFNLVGNAKRALIAAGYKDEAFKMEQECLYINPYSKQLAAVKKYVDIEEDETI